MSARSCSSSVAHLGQARGRAYSEAELLAAVAVGFAGDGRLLQPRGHEAQHLVAHVVAVAVVEVLEVIHVHHGDGIAAAQLAQLFFQRTAALAVR